MRIIQPNFVNIGHETVLFDTIIVREPDVNKNNDVHRYGPYWNRYYRLVNWPDNSNNNNIDKLPANWLRLNIHRNVVATYMPIAPFLQHLDPCVINQHVSWMQYRLPGPNPKSWKSSNIILIMRVNPKSGWNMATPPHELEIERVLDTEAILAQLKSDENGKMNQILDQVAQVLQRLRPKHNTPTKNPRRRPMGRPEGPSYEQVTQSNHQLFIQLLIERARKEILLEQSSTNTTSTDTTAVTSNDTIPNDTTTVTTNEPENENATTSTPSAPTDCEQNNPGTLTRDITE